MYAVPAEVERPITTGMTINDSYDIVLDHTSSIQSHDYLPMAAVRGAFSGREKEEFSGQNKAALSGQNKTVFSSQGTATFLDQDQAAFYVQETARLTNQEPTVFYNQDKAELFGQEKATFSSQDPTVIYSQNKDELFSQEKASFSCQKKSSNDTKFRCFCVTLGVVVAIMLLASLVCASIALWMSSRSRNIKEFQAAPRSTMMGLDESNPAASCYVIYFLNPFLTSGYYWIRSSNGSAVHVYCDMTLSCGGLTGGWRRIANHDFSNVSISCPNGLKERGDSGVRTCGIASVFPTCASVILPSNGILYTTVCGMVSAYQFGLTDAFSDFGRGTDLTIDSNYVDGVSLTYGSRPRKHIWTFAAALNDVPSVPLSSCQCMTPNSESIPPAPSFVGQDYFCATGSHNHDFFTVFYASDPLWDGLGCAVNSTCCFFNNPPWFYKQLTSATTEDIEMRVCSDEPRNSDDIALSEVEIYVQ